ncbi:MAG: hypothetical protein ACTSWU_00945 [Candidatus Thorarchaeota archaeon]
MSQEFPDGIDWTEIAVMDDWIGLNGGLFFNVEKSYRGKRVIFTLKLDKGEITPLTIGSSDPKRFGTEKFRFVPPETQPSLNILELDSVSFKDAFDYLVEQYKSYLYLLESEYYELLALGAMSTYFREVFYSYPYFDFYAREYNCGKTTAMKCLIWASFYGFLPLDPTGPVLFRAIDGCHSAVGLDELDNVIQDESGRSNIIGLLNAAYQKGTPAYRIDMERGGEVVPYDPFGLKAFTHTSPLPNSFSSRSIVIVMYRTPEPKKQLRTPDVFQTFRDYMYRLRLDNALNVDETYEYILKNCELLNRGRDRFAPLLTMAYLVDVNLYEKIHAWAKEYLSGESPTSFDEVDRTLVELLRNMGNSCVELAALRKKWNKVLQDRELASKDYGSRTLSKKLESFGFSKSTYRAGNRVHYDISPKRLSEWVRIYNLPENNLDNLDNPQPEDKSQELLVSDGGSVSAQSTSEEKPVNQVNQVKFTGIDKWLIDNRVGSSFMPSTLELEDPDAYIYQAMMEGWAEEEKVGGPYRFTKEGRDKIKELLKK